MSIGIQSVAGMILVGYCDIHKLLTPQFRMAFSQECIITQECGLIPPVFDRYLLQ